MDGRCTSDLTEEELLRGLIEAAAALRVMQHRLRSKIGEIALSEGWDLEDPRAIARSVRTRFGFDISEEVLAGVLADAAIDAAYPRRACAERIAFGTVAREAMEAFTP